MKTLLLVLSLFSSLAWAQNFDATLYITNKDMAPVELTWPHTVTNYWNSETNAYSLLLSFQAPENYRIEDASSSPGSLQHTISLKSLSEQKTVRILGPKNEVLSKSLLHITVNLKKSIVIRGESCAPNINANDVIKDATNYLLKITCDDKVHISGILNSHTVQLVRDNETQSVTLEKPEIRPVATYKIGGFYSHTQHEGPDFGNLGVHAKVTHPFHEVTATHELKLSLLSMSDKALQPHHNRYYAFDSRFALPVPVVKPFFGVSYRQLYLPDNTNMNAFTANVGLQHSVKQVQLLTQASVLETGAHKVLVDVGGRYLHGNMYYQFDLEYFYASRVKTITLIPSMGVIF